MKVGDVKVMWKRSCKIEYNVKVNVGGIRPKESSRGYFRVPTFRDGFQVISCVR